MLMCDEVVTFLVDIQENMHIRTTVSLQHRET